MNEQEVRTWEKQVGELLRNVGAYVRARVQSIVPWNDCVNQKVHRRDYDLLKVHVAQNRTYLLEKNVELRQKIRDLEGKVKALSSSLDVR